jgi:hypothetical protein
MLGVGGLAPLFWSAATWRSFWLRDIHVEKLRQAAANSEV